MSVAQGSSRASGLSAAEKRAYREDGLLVLRRVFGPAEMARLSDEADALLRRVDLIDKLNLRCRFQQHCDGDDCLFETFDPVIDLSPACRDCAHDRRILDVLAEVFGEEAFLFKDKLIFKPPGAAGYRLHQDYIGWPGFPRTFLTVLVPIDEANEENGCTEVFPGCHHRGYLSPEDGEYHDLSHEFVDENRGVKLLLEPGDIAIFGGYTPHRSAPNRSSGPRRQLYLSYNAASDGDEQRTAHYAEFHRFLRRKYAEFGLKETYFV